MAGKIKFQCSKCKEILQQGMCGEHREETGHAVFDVIEMIEGKIK